MDSQNWSDFVRALRTRQDKLRAELKPYLAGTILAPDASGRFVRDDKTIATIEQEIASLQATIDRGIAERGLSDA